MQPLEPPGLDEVHAAAERLKGVALRTPLIPLCGRAGDARILLKLENLQPGGSFKIRGATNALACADPAALERGVVTASAGNFAQGLALRAAELGIACRVVVPDHAPRAKLDPLERLGCELLAVPFERWWQCLEERGHPELEGHFLHPVSEPAVIAGNATIGLEIHEDCPEVEAVIVPYGGGGLSCGIASALRALDADTNIYAAEVETAAPLAASFEAGEPVEVEYIPSFVDGIGGRGVLPEMWPLADALLNGSLVVDLDATAEALLHLLLHNHVLAEGAGAAALAAALEGASGESTIVCVISGGNLDLEQLASLLARRYGA